MLGELTPVMVTLKPETRGLPSTEELRSRFGLTELESAVALLLARRYANDEVARCLKVSPHTARHHTERVLRRLGVKSRNDVRSRLGRTGPTDTA